MGELVGVGHVGALVDGGVDELQVRDATLHDELIESSAETCGDEVGGVDSDRRSAARTDDAQNAGECFGPNVAVGEGAHADGAAVCAIGDIERLGKIGFEECAVDRASVVLLRCCLAQHFR